MRRSGAAAPTARWPAVARLRWRPSTGTARRRSFVELFAEFGVDYIYIGPAERAQYGTDIQGEARLASLADLVFSSGDVRIYRVR